MPVISPPRRYSTASTGSSSYLPPSVGGHTSSSLLGKTSSSTSSSGYRSSSICNITPSTYSSSSSGYNSGSSYLSSRSSYYRPSSLYGSSSSLSGGTSSSYRYYGSSNSYLTGGNNDTTSASARFGVSNRYSRSSSDNTDTCGSNKRSSSILTSSGKNTQNNNNNITISRTTKTLQTKPPISGTGSIRRKKLLSEQINSKSDHNHNLNDINLNSSSDTTTTPTTINSYGSSVINNKQRDRDTTTTKTGQKDTTKTKKSSLSSSILSPSLSSSSIPSSLARQVATSGLDIYEKYSPANYIPKCELSRSRSLSEATTSLKLQNSNTNDLNSNSLRSSNKNKSLNNHSSNLISNSSCNINQLLHQTRDNLKLDENNLNNNKDKDYKLDNKVATSSTLSTATTTSSSTPTTTSTATSVSSSALLSSSKDNNKVKNQFVVDAAYNSVLSSYPPFATAPTINPILSLNSTTTTTTKQQSEPNANAINCNQLNSSNIIVINSNSNQINKTTDDTATTTTATTATAITNYNENIKSKEITKINEITTTTNNNTIPIKVTKSFLPKKNKIVNNINCCNPLLTSSSCSINENSDNHQAKISKSLSVVDIVTTTTTTTNTNLNTTTITNHSYIRNNQIPKSNHCCEHYFMSNLNNHKEQVEYCSKDSKNYCISPTPPQSSTLSSSSFNKFHNNKNNNNNFSYDKKTLSTPLQKEEQKEERVHKEEFHTNNNIKSKILFAAVDTPETAATTATNQTTVSTVTEDNNKIIREINSSGETKININLTSISPPNTTTTATTNSADIIRKLNYTNIKNRFENNSHNSIIEKAPVKLLQNFKSTTKIPTITTIIPVATAVNLQNKKFDEKIMSNNSYSIINNSYNSNNNKSSSVTVTHRTIDGVTISSSTPSSSPITVTTVNAANNNNNSNNIKSPIRILSKNRCFDSSLDFYKSKQLQYQQGLAAATTVTVPTSTATNATVINGNSSSVKSAISGIEKRSVFGSSGGSGSGKGGNSVFYYSTYRNKNFLKNEYELARSQVVNNNNNADSKFSPVNERENETRQQQQQNNENETVTTIQHQAKQQHDNNNITYNTNSNNANNIVSRINITSNTSSPVKNSNLSCSSSSTPTSSLFLNENANSKNSSSTTTATILTSGTRNLIKPLVHKTTKLAKILTNSNMNCLQNSPELLDDIKYIDSDDSERQHQHRHNTVIKTVSPASITTTTQTTAASALQQSQQLDKQLSSSRSSSPSSSISIQKNNILGNRQLLNTKSIMINSATSSPITVSTLPLTSKRRDLINNSDTLNASSSNNKQTTTNKIQITNKYNTLNDFKRIPSSIIISGVNSRFLSNSGSSHYVTAATVTQTTTTTTTATATISTTTTPATKTTVMSNIINLPNKSTSTTLIIGNNYGTKSSVNSSHDSTPSNSPQLSKRKNLLSNKHYSSSTSSLSQPQQQQQNEHNGISPSSTSSSPSNTLLNDKKQQQSNKSCDIDDSIRNASIRSALQSSPTLSRSWDREGRSSLLSSRKTDADDLTSTKTLLNNSSDSYEKSSSKVEGLCGLRNIGNTCFMNSVIQCLSHTKELTKYLRTQATIRSTSKDQQIMSEFAKLIREMWSPNVHSVTPLDLKSAFSSKHRMYSGYNQQDAQEFLRFFLDSLHCALNSGAKGESLKIDDSLSDNIKADITWEWYSKVENSVIKDLFVGQLKSTLKCTSCGNTSVTFDPFWDLSVPLPSSSRCKLDACLDLFIREEVLDGDEMPTCSKCKTRRKCTKSFTIQRFPKYLVIHLKRFSETRWSKLSNIVEFPIGERELNMAPYASNPSTNTLYTLYAISNHMGSTAGGHYVALCKHPVTKKWHEFNDNIVSDDLSESVLVSSSAYLLFYERA